MKLSNSDLKDYFEKNFRVPCEESEIQKTVSFARQAYFRAEEAGFLSKLEFLYCQSRYIKKRWWAFQGALLTLLWLFLKYADSTEYIQRMLGTSAPLFVLLIVPEVWKNRNANAVEVECTTVFSIREIYAARLVLFAMVDLTLLSIFFIAASYTAKLTLMELIIQFLVPFNVTCCICFRLLYSKKESAPAVALLLCIVWTAAWGWLLSDETVYQAVSVPVWGGLLLLSGVYLGYSIWKGQKSCIQTWEVKMVWN